MTDKERIEKTYRKIQTKYPHITSKEEIDNLAIKLDKRNTLLMSLGCLAGAIVCGIVFFLLIGNETYETTRYLFLVMTGSGIFECFRTLGKYSKIEQRYRPILKVKYEGQLTKDKILQDGGKVLKKAEYVFDIVKLPLFDKEDETDVGIDNDTHHKYYLHFTLPENDLKVTYKVKRDQYMDSVIGAEYFVIVTPSNEIAMVYQATNWSLDNELGEFLVGSQPQLQEQPVVTTVANEAQPNVQAYQPSTIQTTTEPEKTKKLLPILSIVLIVLSYFTPIIVGVPMGIAALVLAIVGLVKQRTKLSITALIINVVLFLLLVVSVIATITGAV